MSFLVVEVNELDDNDRDERDVCAESERRRLFALGRSLYEERCCVVFRRLLEPARLSGERLDLEMERRRLLRLRERLDRCLLLLRLRLRTDRLRLRLDDEFFVERFVDGFEVVTDLEFVSDC